MRKSSTRKANQSGTCRCAVCGARRKLIVHHILGRDVPDYDREWNRVSICDNCHRDLHTSPPVLVVRGWLSTTAGRKLDWYRCSVFSTVHHHEHGDLLDRYRHGNRYRVTA